MSKLSMFLWCVAVWTLAFGLSGCGDPQDASSPAPSNQAQTDEHAGHTHANTEIEKAMAQLSSEDRAAAEKQRICPVSGASLGSMGEPYKVTAKGRDVFLCCQGCEGSFNEDPDKYLAKLNQ